MAKQDRITYANLVQEFVRKQEIDKEFTTTHMINGVAKIAEKLGKEVNPDYILAQDIKDMDCVKQTHIGSPGRVTYRDPHKFVKTDLPSDKVCLEGPDGPCTYAKPARNSGGCVIREDRNIFKGTEKAK